MPSSRVENSCALRVVCGAFAIKRLILVKGGVKYCVGSKRDVFVVAEAAREIMRLGACEEAEDAEADDEEEEDESAPRPRRARAKRAAVDEEDEVECASPASNEGGVLARTCCHCSMQVVIGRRRCTDTCAVRRVPSGCRNLFTFAYAFRLVLGVCWNNFVTTTLSKESSAPLAELLLPRAFVFF
jgi:hypothetical protein